MTRHRPVLSAALWVLLVVSAVANSVLSFAAVPVATHVAVGLLSALGVAGLVALHLRRVR
jgi:FtsH-binding integral membrane protein